MGADEMQTITTDKWTDDIWGIGTGTGTGASANKPTPTPRLVFYFGQNDHWVAEQTRDEIMALRGRQESDGPKMLVCDDGVPHAFCLSEYILYLLGCVGFADVGIGHSGVVAGKVTGMIGDIVGEE